jgi:hypothetical protein
MTSIDKSPEQLDAEATAPAVGLRWLIVDLRRAFRYEIPDRIHQQHTSKSPDDETDAKGWAAYPDEGGVGLPFSARMHRYLRTNAGPSKTHRWDMGPDPKVRPAMAAVVNASERCHARHTNHLRPGYTRSLCAEMMLQVGYLGQEPKDIAWHFDLPLEQVEKMLTETLRHAYSWRYDTEQRLSRIPGNEEPIPERARVMRAV